MPSIRVTGVSREEIETVIADTHYIGRPGSTSVSLGLWLDDDLAGVITYGTIPAPNARAICGPEWEQRVLELTRLAVYDWAPRNTESRFIAESFRYLRDARPDVSILISYADSGYGHVGTIYQATNWIYTGISGGDVLYRCADGRLLHPRTVGWDDLPEGGGWVASSKKHRYVQFLGSAREKRVLRRDLRWSPLAYPKPVGMAIAHHAEAHPRYSAPLQMRLEI
jgi:hypothetical protein